MLWTRLARTITRAALAALLASGPLAASQAKPETTAGQIGGTVTSAADDAPVPRARVIAVAEPSGDPHVAIAGADGKYIIQDLRAGRYTVSVVRTGYATQSSPAAAPVVVTAGQASRFDVALVAGRSIAGRILDEDGTPFAGAVVEALAPRVEAGAETLVSVASTQTDDRGAFRLFGLPPGQYYVSAADPAFRSVATPSGVQRYAPTYYPGVAFPDRAKAIGVTGSEAVPQVEFRLSLVPPARVAGRLAAEGGRPLLNGAIVMTAGDGAGVPVSPPADPSLLPDGRFNFGQVAPGRYQIRARGQTEASGVPLFGTYAVEVLGRDVDDIRIDLRPGAQLEGTVTIAARPGSASPGLQNLRVRAPFTDGSSFGDALGGAVRADGAFAVRGLMHGAHQLVVEGLQPPWFVQSILYRGSEISDRPLEVNDREQLRDIHITVSDRSGRIDGVVENARGAPVANAGVIVFPRVPLFWVRTNQRMRAASTDAAGRFSIAALPPGDYVAVASLSIDAADLGRPDRLRALEAIGTPFRIDAAAPAHVTLQLAVPPTAAAAAR
jgi:hypothetical protein